MSAPLSVSNNQPRAAVSSAQGPELKTGSTLTARAEIQSPPLLDRSPWGDGSWIAGLNTRRIRTH